MNIPNLFWKRRIPKEIPSELNNKIKEFSREKNKELFLKKSFQYITRRWFGPRYNLLYKFKRLYYVNPQKIMNSQGYMHCTNMNYVLRIMLVKSGLFSEKDVKLRLTTNYLVVPHQFLRIKLSENKYIEVDPWAYQFGIDFGEYSSGFKHKDFYPNIKRLNGKLIISKNAIKKFKK